MFAIFALCNGHFQMAGFETFYTVEEALLQVREYQKEADSSVRFFIECTYEKERYI